jgi:hypothetical protein
MPEYRAIRFINTREPDTCYFSAENGEAARAMLLSGAHPGWSGDADLVECDVTGEVFALDRRKAGGAYETVEDEIPLPGEKSNGQPSRDFVSKAAKLGAEGAYDDALETLERLAAALSCVPPAACNEASPIPRRPSSVIISRACDPARPWRVASPFEGGIVELPFRILIEAADPDIADALTTHVPFPLRWFFFGRCLWPEPALKRQRQTLLAHRTMHGKT